jgi:hypothetical protein
MRVGAADPPPSWPACATRRTQYEAVALRAVTGPTSLTSISRCSADAIGSIKASGVRRADVLRTIAQRTLRSLPAGARRRHRDGLRHREPPRLRRAAWCVRPPHRVLISGVWRLMARTHSCALVSGDSWRLWASRLASHSARALSATTRFGAWVAIAKLGAIGGVGVSRADRGRRSPAGGRRAAGRVRRLARSRTR